MYTVYALASINHKYVYVGITANLPKRLQRHNKGFEKTTKPYAPFLLIFSEIVDDRPAARIREKHFKSRTGKRFLYRTIQNDFQSLTQYF